MILATDMSRHFHLVSEFKTRNTENCFEDADYRLDIFRLIMKAADIGHAAKSWELHEQWSFRLLREFYQQGDSEQQQGLPISMNCDRKVKCISGGQAWFLRNMVLPLYITLNGSLSSSAIESECIEELTNNVHKWESEEITFHSLEEKLQGGLN